MNAHTPSQLRSLLFVPADSERKLEASLRSGADALIFDLEDAVHEEGKGAARKLLTQFLATHRRSMSPLACVRINGLSTAHLLDDLAAIVPHRPDAIVLPKCRNAETYIGSAIFSLPTSTHCLAVHNRLESSPWPQRHRRGYLALHLTEMRPCVRISVKVISGFGERDQGRKVVLRGQEIVA